MAMKKVMIIAGGDWQIELVKKAKKMGCHVLCSNLYEDSPAFPYADICKVANVLDKEKNLEFAREYKPDAVLSDQSDIAIPTVAYINKALGLRGISPEMADIFTDKSMMRQWCKEHDIDIPDFKKCKTVEEAEQMLEKHGKIIIKPIDSQSARGVFTITDITQLKEMFPITMSFTNRRKEIMAEEYMDGDEFTIDGLAVNGVHHPLCISIKKMFPDSKNVSMEQTYSYSHPVYNYDLLRQTNKTLIEKTGLPCGLTHTEYKFYKGKFYLLEMAARGGGSNLSAKIVPYMSNVDNYAYLIKNALGEPLDERALENIDFPKNHYVIMRFFGFGEGKVKKIHGIDYLKNSPFLMDYRIAIKEGDVLHKPQFGSERHGHFTICGADKEKVDLEYKEILNKVYVEFEK